MRTLFKSGQALTLSSKATYTVERKGALEYEVTVLHEGKAQTTVCMSFQKALSWVDTTVNNIIHNQYIGKHT